METLLLLHSFNYSSLSYESKIIKEFRWFSVLPNFNMSTSLNLFNFIVGRSEILYILPIELFVGTIFFIKKIFFYFYWIEDFNMISKFFKSYSNCFCLNNFSIFFFGSKLHTVLNPFLFLITYLNMLCKFWFID